MRRTVLTRLAIAIVSPILFLALLEFAVAAWGFQYPPADSPIAFVDPLLRVRAAK